MQYAIVVIDLLKIEESIGCKMLSSQLKNVREKVDSISDIETLTENTFLIPLNEKSSSLLHLLNHISSLPLTYKMAILENKPTFILSPPLD